MNDSYQWHFGIAGTFPNWIADAPDGLNIDKTASTFKMIDLT